jgi:hypothetical protein
MKTLALVLLLTPLAVRAGPKIACQVDALDKAEWARLKALVPRLTAAVAAKTELPEGYAFRFPASAVPLLGDWTWYVARCCPMVDYRLEISAATRGDLLLTMTGGEGVKEFITLEFAPLFDAVAARAAAK